MAKDHTPFKIERLIPLNESFELRSTIKTLQIKRLTSQVIKNVKRNNMLRFYHIRNPRIMTYTNSCKLDLKSLFSVNSQAPPNGVLKCVLKQIKKSSCSTERHRTNISKRKPENKRKEINHYND